MKKSTLALALFFLSIAFAQAQIDKESLSLEISRAEEENRNQLKEYIWKRRSDVFIESQLKLTTITEFSFDPQGKLVTKIIEAKTTVEKKPGLRGKAQASAAEDKIEYIQKALALSMDYAMMSKGELLDFFDKATVTEKEGFIEAVATGVRIPGDRLLVRIDPETLLFTYKEFNSLLGNDRVEGTLSYSYFSNGTSHLESTSLNLPAQKMTIESANQDYTIRVQ
ncbi:hypothetical protein Aoki45_14860 [Algoriphagus sp. oki45]|uniref:hypothetical protein n=1 Tax=Algoriphagus sp. oki45 TaxID=3067294 RepID=UPI0027F73DDC|nr:hypothetical protein Aoki45_14860 [Algoriphagus sp. oki45]